jgi:hypothetical protein
MVIHEIVHMISVRYSLMPAVWSMNVIGLVCAAIVFRRALVWVLSSSSDLMIVHVVVMHVVQVPIMKIVCVAIVLHRRVAAICTVGVRVPFVLRTGLGAHNYLHSGPFG